MRESGENSSLFLFGKYYFPQVKTNKTKLKTNMKKITTLIILIILAAAAAPPPRVPGEKLTNEMFFNYLMSKRAPADTTQDNSQEETPSEENRLPWHSWHSLPIHDQIALDTTAFRHGNGALFVPRMSAGGNMEPHFLVFDAEHERVAVGETGRKINLLPGRYTLSIVENVPFEINQEFEIVAGEITPIMPSWAGVIIEVIDETGKPIRGEYDLALLDPLMSIGRGRGRDIDLAEDLRVWFLPVGYYKIIGVGSPLNTITNFLTFRITDEGEFMRLTLVQDPQTLRILGGGVLLGDLVSYERRTNWTSSINLGGSIDFNYIKDDFLDTISNTTKLSLLLFIRNNYRKDKLEIMNLKRIDVSFLLDDMKWNTLRTSSDELRINTLFTYRLLPRSGPYWRGELVSSAFPQTASFYHGNTTRRGVAGGNFSHLFIFWDNVPDTISDATPPAKIDAQAATYRISPAFSPLQLQTGGGYNVQIVRNRIIDTRFLSGFGVEYEKKWNSWRIVSERNLNFDIQSDIFQNIYNTNIDRITLEKNDGERFDYGPEFMLNYLLYITRYLSLDGNVRLFMPIERFSTPDFRSHTLLTFRLTQYLNIDYDYTFDLIQASQDELRVKSNRHRILARFSFARR